MRSVLPGRSSSGCASPSSEGCPVASAWTLLILIPMLKQVLLGALRFLIGPEIQNHRGGLFACPRDLPGHTAQPQPITSLRE